MDYDSIADKLLSISISNPELLSLEELDASVWGNSYISLDKKYEIYGKIKEIKKKE